MGLKKLHSLKLFFCIQKTWETACSLSFFQCETVESEPRGKEARRGVNREIQINTNLYQCF